jgi:hypothetical protein
MRKVLDGLVDINHIWVSFNMLAEINLCNIFGRSRKPLQLSFFTMDEFEQALNHAYTPPTQSKFPRAVPLMAEIHSTLLTHICDRADKPASWSWDGKGVLYDSLDAQAEALQKEYDKLAVVMPSDEAEAQAYAADIKQFAKFGGSEEEVQAHVWRTKLGGIKPVELNIEELRDSMTRTVCMNPDWRSGAIGDEDERVGWEIVLLGCLAEVCLLVVHWRSSLTMVLLLLLVRDARNLPPSTFNRWPTPRNYAHRR